jgi:hypothetical protein
MVASAIPRCRELHPLTSGELVSCQREKLILPSGSRSKFCYWDRLASTSKEAQVRAARRRLAGEPAELAMFRNVYQGNVLLGTKSCLDCNSVVPLWYTSGTRCIADAYSKRRSQRNQRVYGVSPDEFERVFQLQGGRCAICGNESLDRSIALDHDHKTGSPRGLLCKRCNNDLLGAAFDSLRILRNAVRYLEHPPFSGSWEGRIEK